jgi:aspartate/methionine/tyrosine aminotransferase
MRISERAERIEPFWVMEVAKAASQKAREVAHTDRPVVFLNIGEPDFTAPPRFKLLRRPWSHPAKPNTPPLWAWTPCAQAISAWYTQRFGVQVPASRIVVTAVHRQHCNWLVWH